MLKKTFNWLKTGLIKNYVYLFGAVILDIAISSFFNLDLNLLVGINLIYVGLVLVGSALSKFWSNFSFNLTQAKVDLSSISIAFSKEYLVRAKNRFVLIYTDDQGSATNPQSLRANSLVREQHNSTFEFVKTPVDEQINLENLGKDIQTEDIYEDKRAYNWKEYLPKFNFKFFLVPLPFVVTGLLILALFSSTIPGSKTLKVEAAATPTAAVSMPANVLLGQNFTFGVGFSNTGTNTGYGPYVDLVFPVTGADGAGVVVDDGINFLGATYLGTAVTATQLTFPVSGGICIGGQTAVIHPYAVDTLGASIQVCGTPGDKLVVLQLPFGSYVTNQPVADLVVSASLSNLADVGTPLTIQSRAGFRYGNDALNNFTTDPSIFGTFQNNSTTPSFLSMTKTNNAPEGETATGPNYPRTWTLNVSVASGQVVNNLDVQDQLPNNVAFLNVVSTTPSTGVTITQSPTIGVPNNSPNNVLNVRFNSITGSGGGTDAQVVFQYFVTDKNASNTDVISHTTGTSTTSLNNASASGSWTPIDTRDPVSPVTANAANTLTDKSLAIQKSVADLTDASPSPGDTLQYTMNFQVSDYFAFNQMVLNDTFTDGQEFDTTFTPTLSVGGQTPSALANFNGSNFSYLRNSPGTGSTAVSFNVSNELITRGQNGQLLGGCVPIGGGTVNCTNFNVGAKTGTVTFRVKISESYTDNFPSGNANVKMGDTIGNAVTVNANLLNNSNLSSLAQNVSDTSGTTTNIVTGNLQKTIYAVNGSTSFPSPVVLGPGDNVTYRLQYDLAITDLENFYLTDFLPLPAFNATSISTTFDPTISATAPPAGQAKFGPSDTFFGISGIVPAITTASGANSVKFTYGFYDDLLNRPSVGDILFTVQMQNEPFADGMFLTNQVQSNIGNTNQVQQTANSIVQVKINLPNLSITKGVVKTDNAAGIFAPVTTGPVSFSAPGTAGSRLGGTVNSTNITSTPIKSDLSGVDSGDLVTFAVAIENTGAGPRGAFDVTLKDLIPAGFSIPGTGPNLSVTNGAGTSLPFTAVNGGDTNPYFQNGIKLTDPSGTQGSLTSASLTSGQNIAIVTYDLIVDPTVQPNVTLTNTATLVNYSGLTGGVNYVASGNTDSANVTTSLPTIAKTITGTDQASTSGNNVAVGEKVNYQVVVTVPEGVSNSATLVDSLDAGLAIVSVDSISPSSGSLTTSVGGGFASVLSSANVANIGVGNNNLGRSLSLNFGTLTNSNTINTTPETLTVNYTVIVLNSSDVARGGLKNNSVVFNWNNSTAQNITTAAPNVTIQESSMKVTKTPNPVTGDAGDTITYTVVVSQNAIANNTTAFNVNLSDILPAKTTYVATSLTNTAGLVPTTLSESGGTISASWNTFLTTDTSTFTFQATLNNTVSAGEVIANTATVTYTSLPGTVNTAQSLNNPLSVERTGNTGDIGGAVNTYSTSGTGNVTINPITPLKSIVSTSEADTTLVAGTERVVVGEVVRYKLSIKIPEGTSGPNFRVTDNIPTGMRFLNDGTATVGLVFNGAGISSDVVNTGTSGCSGLNFTGNTDVVTPTCPIPAAQITPASFASGTDPIFNLGTLTNTDNDADSEFAVIYLNAVVENVTTGQSATIRNNAFSVAINGGATIGTSANVGVAIAEPVITSTKTVVQAASDAGDTLIYNIAITNTSVTPNFAPAYDLILTDNLNSNLTLVSTSILSQPGYAVLVDNSTGNNVSYSVSKLNPADTINIRVTATVNNSTNVGTTIANTAGVTYTSLPGSGTIGNPTGSNTPGASGTATGERTGTDGVGGVLNDYAANGLVNNLLSTTPTIAKTGPVQTTYRIGDTLTYNLKATLPEGTTQSLVLNDIMAAGLQYVSYNVVTASSLSGGVLSSDFNGTVSSTPTVNTVGNTTSFTFGNTLTNGDNVAGNNAFLLQVTVRVRDVVGNITGTVLANNASLVYTNATSGSQTVNAPTPVNITVIQPNLTLTKSFSPTSAAPGDTVTVTLVATNTGNSDAFDVNLSDNLISSFTNITELSTPTGFTFALSGNNITYTGGDILASQNKTFTFTTTIASGLTNGTFLSNTASINQYFSIPTGSTGRRQYALVNASANETVITPDLRLLKTDGVSLATLSDVLTYTLTASNIGSYKADNVIITENIPLYTTFVAGSSNPGWSCGPITCTINIGTLNPAGSQNITFAVQVQPTPFIAGVNTLTNTATVTDDGTHGPDVNLANNTATDVDNLGASPDLRVVKTDGVSSVDAGGSLTYTLTVDNIGTQNATGVFVSDTLPANTSFVSATSGGSNSAGTVIWNVGNLAVGSSVNLSVTVNVSNAIPAGINSLTNSAFVTDDGTNGVDINLLNNTGIDTDTLNAFPDLAIVKTTPITQISPGQLITYTLNYNNHGSQGATGVVISETVPLNTTFVVSSSTTGWSCIDGAPGGTICNFNLGSLSVGATGTISFAVKVINQLPSGSPQIQNTAAIADDGTNGPEISLTDNSSNVSTNTQAGPDLNISKTDSTAVAAPGNNLVYAISYSNNGNRGATGVVISETVPANTIFVASSSSAGWSCSDGAAAGTVCNLTISSLAAGSNGSRNFAVSVNGSIPSGSSSIINTATITDDGTNGTDQNPSDNQTTDTDSLTASPDLYINKTPDSPTKNPGQDITFSLNYANNGNKTSTGIIITETVPANTTFVSTGSTAGWSCPNASPAGSTCNFTLTSLAPSQTGSLTFVVKINLSLSSGILQITNNASISDDGLNGPDANLLDNTTTANVSLNNPTNTTVSGHIFFDSNNNGVQDVGDFNLANISIQITDLISSYSVVTDSNGNYTQVVNPGSIATIVNFADPDIPVGSVLTTLGTGGVYQQNLTAITNQNNPTNNVGFYVPQPTLITGHIFFDTNNNSIQNLGEVNLSRIPVLVTDGSGSKTVYTDANGNYSTTVLPGSVSVNIDETSSNIPAGSTISTNASGGTDTQTVTVLNATTYVTANVGYAQTTSVTGHLFLDLNNNATQDVGEPNLGNVSVVVTDVSGSQTVVTDTNGNYVAFVKPGTVTSSVDLADPDIAFGSVVSTAGVGGTSSQSVTTILGSNTNLNNVGFHLPVTTVSGHLFLDSNNNGVQNLGEPNLANVSVDVVDTSGTKTVITDSNGNYVAQVVAGSVGVNVVLTDPDIPTGSTVSTIGTGGGSSQSLTAILNTNTVSNNVGFYQAKGTVTGHIFKDDNNNGVQDVGEINLANVSIIVTESNGNTQIVNTDSNGNYSAQVVAGNTTVAVNLGDPDLPVGAVVSTSGVGGNSTQVVVAVNNTTSPSTDVGLFQAVVTSITGHLFNDLNGNGIKDPGEPNLVGVKVEVTAGLVTKNLITDENGNYLIEVDPGNVILKIDPNDPNLPPDYIVTTNVTNGFILQNITAIAGIKNNSPVVGFNDPTRISGHVFKDTNGNGIQDPGEPNLVGVAVRITDSTGQRIVYTDANGDYSAIVQPGNVEVEISNSDPALPLGSRLTTFNNVQRFFLFAHQNYQAQKIGYRQLSPSEYLNYLLRTGGQELSQQTQNLDQTKTMALASVVIGIIGLVSTLTIIFKKKNA